MTELAATTVRVRRWKCYHAYRDSGIEWLGEIPEHWKVTRVKYLAGNRLDVVQTGPFGAQLHASDYVDEGIPLVLIRNVDNLQIDDTSIPKISLEKAASLSVYRLEVGDIVFSRVGSVGRVALVSEREKGWLISGQMLRLRVNNPNLNHYFAIFYFYSDRTMDFIDLKSIGSTRESINTEILRNIPISLPPLAEQEAIVSFLEHETTRINALITKKERLIELLQEKRTALISHAVAKGLDPTVPMKDSGVEWLGEIPEHWEVKRLKLIASILRGKFSHRPRNDPQMYDGPYPFIQTGDITATTRYITQYQQTLNELGYAVSKQFPSGTLVMAIAANIGDLAILLFPACFPDSIVGFVPIDRVILDYMYYNLTAMKQVMISTATINTQLNLNIERIGGLFTAYPPISEQQAIVTHLDCETAKIDALISRIREGIEKLKEYSSVLISAAVTGKIDVREAVIDS